MKNLRPLFVKISSIVLIFLTVSLVFSCQQQQTNQITQEDIEAMKKEHLISLNDAVKMYHKYDKLRIKFTKDSLKKRYGDSFQDTRAVWFDIKSIKAYIQYVEENASDAEGFQFYFGVSPNNTRRGKNHQSFFIAPTVKNGDIQSGFTVKNGKRIFLYEAFKESKEKNDAQKASFFNLIQGDDGYLFNSGEENPPFPNN